MLLLHAVLCRRCYILKLLCILLWYYMVEQHKQLWSGRVIYVVSEGHIYRSIIVLLLGKQLKLSQDVMTRQFSRIIIKGKSSKGINTFRMLYHKALIAYNTFSVVFSFAFCLYSSFNTAAVSIFLWLPHLWLHLYLKDQLGGKLINRSWVFMHGKPDRMCGWNLGKYVDIHKHMSRHILDRNQLLLPYLPLLSFCEDTCCKINFLLHLAT